MTVAARTALRPRALALVGAGGAAGAGTRWAVVEALGSQDGFPWWTHVVNIIGCLGLGLLLGRPERVRLGLGAGFCGGLTTFSTFAVESAVMLDTGEHARAAAYVAASVAGGLVAVAIGRRSVANR